MKTTYAVTATRTVYGHTTVDNLGEAATIADAAKLCRAYRWSCTEYVATRKSDGKTAKWERGLGRTFRRTE